MNKSTMPLTTILLDLDNTLLKIDMKQFIPAYVDKLAYYLAEFAPIETMSSLILKATAAIKTNQDTTITNHQAFNSTFFSQFSASSTEIQAAIDRFYEEIYPSLKQYISPRPEAQSLVQHLLATGYKVVIATNPLYPRVAIEQRMAWAGILRFPYTLITNMENMHFCKPSQRYYQEILTIVDSVPAEALMVGDDPKNDIIPAQTVGLKTWWITDQAEPEAEVSPDYQGSLAEFCLWMRENTRAGASAV